MAVQHGSLVAGVDSSTQSTTVVVIDAQTGRQVARGRAPHEVSGTGGARESDPDSWWTALRDALAMTGVAGDIAAISIGAQQHGLVVLGGSGQPLRPAVLWNDTRSGPQTAALVAALGADWWASRIGSVPVPSFTVTRWAWLRETEPAIAAAARGLRLPHDFLTERLTGNAVTDRGDASGSGWWSTATGAYDPDILGLAAIELHERLLPQVMAPDQTAGVIRDVAAARAGLVDGRGRGHRHGRQHGLSAGSSVAVRDTRHQPRDVGRGVFGERAPAEDRSGTVAGFADATGRFLPLTATLNCTLAVDRVAGWLSLDREAVRPVTASWHSPGSTANERQTCPTRRRPSWGCAMTHHRGDLGCTYEGAVVGLLEALVAISDAPTRSTPPLPSCSSAEAREVAGRIRAATIGPSGAGLPPTVTWAPVGQPRKRPVRCWVSGRSQSRTAGCHLSRSSWKRCRSMKPCCRAIARYATRSWTRSAPCGDRTTGEPGPMRQASYQRTEQGAQRQSLAASPPLPASISSCCDRELTEQGPGRRLTTPESAAGSSVVRQSGVSRDTSDGPATALWSSEARDGGARIAQGTSAPGARQSPTSWALFQPRSCRPPRCRCRRGP